MVAMARRQRGRDPVRKPMAQWGAEVFEADQDADLQSFVQRKLADSTQFSYASQVKQYREFCRRCGVEQVPSEGVLAKLTMYRAQASYKLSSIEVMVSAVSAWAERDFGMVGLSHAQQVRSALRGAALVKFAKVSRPKLPITVGMLTRLVRQARAQRDKWIGARDAALFILSWSGMLRSAEARQLGWGDVVQTKKGVMLYIPFSKTDQVGEGAWVFLHDNRGSELSVLRALTDLRRLTEEEEGPVFTATRAATGAAMTTDTMRSRLRKMLDQMGVDGVELFGFHSFRRGGATAAALGQVSERQIRVHGRWRSDCVRKYMYLTAEDEGAWGVTGKMLQGNSKA